MLYYLPLEGYKERYTLQWSAPKTGWLERNWIRAGVDYKRIDSDLPVRTIKSGAVLDAVGRSLHCFEQIKELLLLAEGGAIKDTDVILLDDFWTPGLEALPYAFHLLGIRPRCYAFLHAQSVDEFDFTYPMRSWMRPIERGFGEWLDGIFVCCPTLKDLVCFGGIAKSWKVHVTGHPFSSEEVMERMPHWYKVMILSQCFNLLPKQILERKNQVVWSSRFDAEKNPMFFLTIVEQMIRENADVKFVVCTSAPKLRSNYTAALDRLRFLAATNPTQLEIREGLSKEEYYATLCESKIQFNCASQDFVAITLLESAVAGCYPIYPYFRSFPETFLWEQEFLYQHLDIQDAVGKIKQVLARDDLWTPDAIKKRSWIYKRFDYSWMRMLNKMGIDFLAQNRHGEHKDPFIRGNWLPA